MFQVDKISEKLYKLVGLRNPFNPTYAILDADNQVSRSNYFITDNSFVKIESIKESQDYKDISDADFNLSIKRMQQSSIGNICNRVFNKPDYIDRNLLYTNAHNKIDQEVLSDGFVGFRINVSSDKNIAFKIKRILLDFDTTGDFKLLLFNTSEADPIESQDITITDKTQEVALDWNIDNSGNIYKGDYYLGYIKTGTTPVPFKRNYENADHINCISHLSVERMQVKGHVPETLFDLSLEEGLSESIGLNPDITVYEDFTDLIIQNEMLFARAISLDMTIEILRLQVNSLRDNEIARKSKVNAVQILAEIEGTSSTGDQVLTITGLRPTLTSELAQIATEVEKIKKGYFNQMITVTTLS
jgi:hypothetical protein